MQTQYVGVPDYCKIQAMKNNKNGKKVNDTFPSCATASYCKLYTLYIDHGNGNFVVIMMDYR